MAYEVLLDDLLDDLFKSGIDVSKIHIIEPEYVKEYTKFSEQEKRDLYVKQNTDMASWYL